jgi:hypothetical protein
LAQASQWPLRTGVHLLLVGAPAVHPSLPQSVEYVGVHPSYTSYGGLPSDVAKVKCPHAVCFRSYLSVSLRVNVWGIFKRAGVVVEGFESRFGIGSPR